MINDDDYDDDDDFGPIFPYRLVESKPITKFTFIQAGFTFATGVLRSTLDTLTEISDAVVGHEGYVRGKKVFEDEARLEIETITESAAAEDGE
jgi:hypothetical protein